jgi:tetratricopeptide (TPR) repeat protein
MAEPQTLYAKSWAAFEDQQWVKAQQLCTQRLQQNAVDADALFLAGLLARVSENSNSIFKMHGSVSRALALLSSSVRRNPQNANAWCELGLCYEAIHSQTVPRATMLQKACEAFERGLINNDKHLPCFFNVVRVLSSMGQYEKALRFSEKAATLHPQNPTVHMVLAKNLHDLRRFDEAEHYYVKALAAQPDNALWQWEYAMQLLMMGRFEQGWQHYDARLKAFDWMASGLQMYPFNFALWQGEELKDKTILIHGEQGLGDEIMFASLVPEMIARAKRVILACSPPLVDLFTRSFSCEVIGHYRGVEAVAHWQQGNEPPFLKTINNVDVHCPLGSLPRYLRKCESDFASQTPYLKVSGNLTQNWNKKLMALRTKNETPKLRVGLMWCGNLATGLMGNQKSIPLNVFEPLIKIEGIEWVGLQNTEYGKQLREHKYLNIVDVSDDIKSFDDTAAIIANMDVIISVDTSVAHLAGAIGKTVWVPLCKNADWRWLAEGDKTVWYKSMQLIRQQKAGDWQFVIEQLQQALLAQVAS